MGRERRNIASLTADGRHLLLLGIRSRVIRNRDIRRSRDTASSHSRDTALRRLRRGIRSRATTTLRRRCMAGSKRVR
jgi:hypothetical protein